MDVVARIHVRDGDETDDINCSRCVEAIEVSSLYCRGRSLYLVIAVRATEAAAASSEPTATPPRSCGRHHRSACNYPTPIVRHD
jgi:hypothetical protein